MIFDSLPNLQKATFAAATTTFILHLNHTKSNVLRHLSKRSPGLGLGGAKVLPRGIYLQVVVACRRWA